MSVIFTSKTDCKDCYKCVRSCPMKAIQIADGQAKIVEERCINDGNCINVCPQKAKQVRDTDLELVSQWLEKGEEIAVSLAPSYPVGLNLDIACEIIPILRKLGFSYIQETAWGAEHVALSYQRLLQGECQLPLIASCCPVIVELVEKHYPHLLPHLAPILSPMAFHGKYLKNRFSKVVFIGPCIAKKEEMEQVKEYIDAVLTFQELEKLITEKLTIDWKTSGLLNEVKTEFDGEKPDLARLFPLGGGLLKTANLSTDLLGDEYLTIEGLEEAIAFLQRFPQDQDLKLIEILACKGGCTGGVGSSTSDSLIVSRQRLLKFQKGTREAKVVPLPQISTGRHFVYRGKKQIQPSEEEIRKILLKVGKLSTDDELNCGSCGYNSCREKAIAVYNGMAEVEMCLPYMRSRAESFSNLILSSTPNGVIVTDNHLRVIEINPAAEAMFQVTNDQVKGALITQIMDGTPFAEVLQQKKLLIDLVKYSNGLIVRQSLFYVEKQDLIIGIFADVTREERQKKELSQMREETFKKAQEVIDKQMRVAQEIAGLLGETTAETKVTLTRLMNLLDKK